MKIHPKKILNILLTAALLGNSFTCLTASSASPAILAEFHFEGADPGQQMADSFGNNDDGYYATNGILADGSVLFGSVTGTTFKNFDWAPDSIYDVTETGYTYNGTEDTSVPIMSATKKHNWGEAPYILAIVSTKDYENITFSAKLGGSKSGPAHYELQYSTDGTNYTQVLDSDSRPVRITISDNKILDTAFDNILLPESAADQDKLYIKMAVYDSATIDGGVLSGKSGEAALNDITVSGTKIGSKLYTDSDDGVFKKGSTYKIYYTGTTQNAAVITAFYSKNCLIGYTLNAEEITVPSDTDADTVKVMLWDGTNSMVPLTPAVVTPVN
jgi:hypothetical protein